MTKFASSQEDIMVAQRRVCPERRCGSAAWLVQRDAWWRDVWQLTHATDGGAWIVAAAAPICPRCGTGLLTALELEGEFDTSDILLPGPLLEWLRTL